jgi:imidazolonepropionase-like amidohydrolase
MAGSRLAGLIGVAVLLLGLAPIPPSAAATTPAATPLPEFGPAGPPYVPGRPIALVGGTVIDATGAAPHADWTVLIEGHTIVALGPRDQIKLPSDTRVIDTRGMTVMPGLIDSNQALQLNPLYPSSAAELPIEELRARWEANFQKMPERAYVYLMQGVTSERQTSGPRSRLLPIKREIDAGKIPGPRLFFGAALIMSQPFFDHYTAVNHTPREALAWLHDEFAYFVVKTPKDLDALVGPEFAYWKLYLSDEKFNGKNDFTDAEIRAMIARAHGLGKKIDVHAQQSNDGLRRLLKFDIDSLEHPFYPDFVIDDDIIKGFAAKGITAASLLRVMVTGAEHTMDPQAFDETKFIMSLSPDEYRQLMNYRDKMQYLVNHPTQTGISIYDKGASESDEAGQQGPSLESQLKDRDVSRLNMRHFIQYKVKLSMGTDAPAFMDFLQDDPNALEMASMVELGMTPMEAIIAATHNGAEMLGVEDKLGTLEAGKLADVIVVAGDPIRDIGVLKRVAIVIKDGVRYK